MLVLLGLVAALSLAELSGGVATYVLLPLASHLAHRAAGALAERAPALHASAARLLSRAAARVMRARGLRDVVLSARLLRGPPAGERGAWPADRPPCVEALLRAAPVPCDLDRLRFRDPALSLRLPLACVAPAIGMRPADVLEVRGLDHRGRPWARALRIGDDVDLPLRPRAPAPFAATVANAALERDGRFVADATADARAWAPTVADLPAVAPYVVRDAIARDEDAFAALLLGHSGDCPPGAEALALRALGTDLTAAEHKFECKETHLI
jgi:hypothetical protein